MNRQTILFKTLRQNFHHTTGVSLIAKPNREIVGRPPLRGGARNQKSMARKTWFHFFLEPNVQHVVQEDIGKDW